MRAASAAGCAVVAVCTLLLASSPVTSLWQVVQVAGTPVVVHHIRQAHRAVQEASECHCPVLSKTVAGHRRGRDAVAIFARSERLAALNHTLRLFYRNFNNCFRKDVLIFANGGFTEEIQQKLRAEIGPELKFYQLVPQGKYWSALEWKKDNRTYYHINLNRWHSILVYGYVAKLGYTWLMRLDEDSNFLSCIDHDLFQYVDIRNYSYAYRLEHEEKYMGDILPELIGDISAKLRWRLPSSLLEHFEGGKLNASSWNGVHFYNNFYMTRLSIWNRPVTKKILQAIDDSGIFQHEREYSVRVLDAPLQTLLVKLILPESGIYKFESFSYCHFPRLVVGLQSLLPATLASFVFRLGVPNYQWSIGLNKSIDYAFLSDIERLVFGKESSWFVDLRG